jgi:hypothetical protein
VKRAFASLPHPDPLPEGEGENQRARGDIGLNHCTASVEAVFCSLSLWERAGVREKRLKRVKLTHIP